jgi:hypothetical protein
MHCDAEQRVPEDVQGSCGAGTYDFAEGMMPDTDKDAMKPQQSAAVNRFFYCKCLNAGMQGVSGPAAESTAIGTQCTISAQTAATQQTAIKGMVQTGRCKSAGQRCKLMLAALQAARSNIRNQRTSHQDSSLP